MGALAGAVAGAVIGHQTDSKHGREIGALAGAMAGGAIGGYMDKQQKELAEELAAERASKAIEITRLENEALKLNLNSEVSFAINSSNLNPGFINSLQKLSSVIKKYHQTRITVIGHTDSSGRSAYNQALSQARAEAVASYFTAQGVSPSRVTTRGAGEDEPRADNTTAHGRQLNRRVEILLTPIR